MDGYLSVDLLHLVLRPHHLPETTLGDNGVTAEDGHLVNLGVFVLLRGEGPPRNLIVTNASETGPVEEYCQC